MGILTPFPTVDSFYTVPLVNVTDFYGSAWTISSYTTSGTVPPGLAMSITNSNTLTLSGTPTTFGNYSFGYTVTASRPGFNNRTISDSYTTQVIYQPISATGSIKWSDIGNRCGIIGAISASNSKFKALANGSTATPVSVSTTRSKPTSGSKTVTGVSETWAVPAYQTMLIKIAGAGGGGGTGQTVAYFGPFDCRGIGGGSTGANGSQSSFFGYIAYGGSGGFISFNGTDGGNNQNSNTGGGSNGGAGYPGTTAPGCPSLTGGAGGLGGYFEFIATIGVNGPDYLTSTTIVGGAKGDNGTNGYVSIEWA